VPSVPADTSARYINRTKRSMNSSQPTRQATGERAFELPGETDEA
jgi:hypothetical protein